MSKRLVQRVPKLARPELLREKILIDGQWRTTGKSFDVTDPATTGVLGTVPDCSEVETREAISAAKKRFDSFKNTTARERSALLRKWAELIRENSEDLGQIVSLENGKPFAEAHGEVLSCAQNFEWFSEEAPHYTGHVIASQNPNMRIRTIRQPVGVCGIITPWNFPASMIARKVGAAIAAGCTSVIKPASETPFSALAMSFLAMEAGIPSGAINVVTTRSHTRDVGTEITTSPLVSKITFTGSTPIGKHLMAQAASTVKKVSFELGGNAPFIVFEDADVDKAVAGAMASKFRGSGQTCICANRFFVHEKLYDEFLTKMTAAINALKPGHALDEGTTQGPLINEKSMDKVTAHVKDALAKGGRLLTGGKPLSELGPNFFAPTLIADGTQDMQVFQEETFGPLAAVAKFSSDEEVIAKANSVEVGLAGYFYTKDITRANVVAEALEFGMVGINTGLITEVALPFGGIKESGFGREGSRYGLDDYTIIKSVATNLA